MMTSTTYDGFNSVRRAIGKRQDEAPFEETLNSPIKTREAGFRTALSPCFSGADQGA